MNNSKIINVSAASCNMVYVCTKNVECLARVLWNGYVNCWL